MGGGSPKVILAIQLHHFHAYFSKYIIYKHTLSTKQNKDVWIFFIKLQIPFKYTNDLVKLEIQVVPRSNGSFRSTPTPAHCPSCSPAPISPYQSWFIDRDSRICHYWGRMPIVMKTNCYSSFQGMWIPSITLGFWHWAKQSVQYTTGAWWRGSVSHVPVPRWAF